MFLTDRLTLDAPRRTKDGYYAVRARAARAGVQDYLGYEVDPKGERFAATDVVPVYRPADEVFNPASVHSFLMKPVTNDHPKEAITSANWKDHAGGVVAQAMRDGDHLAFDLVLMDADLIAAVDSGKRGLSNGYAVDLSFEDGTAPDGTPYKAVQRAIVGNHVAVVKNGRAGPQARISDSIALCDALPSILVNDNSGDISVTKIKIGDSEVALSDAGAVAVAVGALQAKFEDASAKLTAAETRLATKDGEIAALTQKVKDAAVTPEKLQQLADERAAVVVGARALAPNIVTDGKPDAAIRREAVAAKLGDAAKDMADAAIEGAFFAFTKDVKPADPLRQAISDGAVTNITDAASIRNAARASRYAN